MTIALVRHRFVFHPLPLLLRLLPLLLQLLPQLVQVFTSQSTAPFRALSQRDDEHPVRRISTSLCVE